MIQKAFIPLMISMVLLFTGCKEKDLNIRIYSDVPEALELVNLFNQTQNQYKASFHYMKSEDNKNPENYDILILRSLHSETHLNNLLPLDNFRQNAFVQSLYPEILKCGIDGTELKLIPLSLDMAVIMASELPQDQKYMPWEELSAYSQDFNVEKEDILTNCGFSPLWSESFIKSYILNQIHSWSDEIGNKEFAQVKQSIASILDWIISSNGSLEKDMAFSRKYRYIPDYRLIMENRIAYDILPLSQWALLPDSIIRDLAFQGLFFPEGLQALEIISAGIPLSAGEKEGSMVFLEWLLQNSSWEDYLTLTQRNRDDSFGILGGISSSEDINLNSLADFYPDLSGSFPRKGEFATQSRVEDQWDLLWNSLLLPMIIEKISSDDAKKSFSEEYAKWTLLNPDPWEEK